MEKAKRGLSWRKDRGAWSGQPADGMGKAIKMGGGGHDR